MFGYFIKTELYSQPNNEVDCIKTIRFHRAGQLTLRQS